MAKSSSALGAKDVAEIALGWALVAFPASFSATVVDSLG